MKRQPNLTPKSTEKKNKKSPKVSRRKEIIKIRSEINEKEMKETTTNINKTKSWLFEMINKIGKSLAKLIKKKGEKSNQQNPKKKKKKSGYNITLALPFFGIRMKTDIFQSCGQC